MTHPQRIRRGLTLIELLVVILIITTIVAGVIPVLAPSMEKRRVREAARSLNAYISTARARAIQNGRPVGVRIERMENEPNAAMVVTLAEVPPPFAGLTMEDTVKLVDRGDGSFTAQFGAGYGAAFSPHNRLPDGMIRPGDRLQLNYQGHLFELIDTNIAPSGYYTASSLRVTRAGGTGVLPFAAGKTQPGPFQVFRQPVRSSAAPLQLPEGTVIDLVGSGTDDDTFIDPEMQAIPPFHPVTFTFTPTGRIDFVIHEHQESASDPVSILPERPASSIYLLVGRREAVGDPAQANWLDLDNLWVSVAAQTGQIGVAEMASQISGSITMATDPASRAAQILEARRFAREMHTMGGR
jgi:prepilin-type N-terminal cleavage/methylation domain-containing protein